MRKIELYKAMLAFVSAAAVMSGCGSSAGDAGASSASVEAKAEAGAASENADAAQNTAGTEDPSASEISGQKEAEENASAGGNDEKMKENPAEPQAEKNGETPPVKPADADGAEKPEGEPPAKPDGNGSGAPGGNSGPGGNPPEGGPGGMPPEGAPGGNDGPGMPGGPGGGSSKPESYDAVKSFGSDDSTTGKTYSSTGKDENAILVENGTVTIDQAEISRTSEDSTGGDSASFYGVGAAALSTGGTLKITNSTITTDAAGGAGAFAYGDGVIYISDSTITTVQNTSGGIHAAGGGTLYADNVTAETSGGSAAAIRSDRGGGQMVVTGGEYTSHGSGSPAVYCTADILVSNAKLTATGSEAVCIEGRNSLKLTDCDLSGSMPDDTAQNDNTWTVIVYQSMSGDSELGCGSFSMKGGTLTSTNGGLFYTTNTESEITLDHVQINAAKDCEFLLQCTGNQNTRGWGQSGDNGADCTFTASNQTLEGDVIWDSISTLEFYLKESSALTGAFIDNESWTGSDDPEEPAGDGHAALYIDASSVWIVTGDSMLTTLENKGLVTDPSGHIVSITGTDGTVYVEGDSSYTVTVENYKD